jgi:hypothetical protein
MYHCSPRSPKFRLSGLDSFIPDLLSSSELISVFTGLKRTFVVAEGRSFWNGYHGSFPPNSWSRIAEQKCW